jgi:tetratricopeptide (TPR) repeat protein
MPGPNTKYKIRISADRTIGPLDWERVEALVMKGRITGQEPTAAEPFTQWAPFESIPALAQLLLKKIESDRKELSRQEVTRTQASGSHEAQGTRTKMQSEPTKTMAQESTQQSSLPPQEEPSMGIPTLVDIPIEVKPPNPDLEQTKVSLVMPSPDQEGQSLVADGGTRVLQLTEVDRALAELPALNAEGSTNEIVPTESMAPTLPAKNIFGQAIDEKQYVTETGKKRLISRNTAALLALVLLLVTYFGTQQEEQEDPANIRPRFHTFPYVEVNVPPRLGATPNVALSAELAEKGATAIEKESPSDYIRAIRQFLYPAAGRNPNNFEARALLASAYIRISEIIPRDSRLFETVEKLLLPGPNPMHWTPEYATALAEFYLLLNRQDQAQETLDTFLKRRTTPELLYQRARVAYERRDLDSAQSFINRAIPPEKVGKANPRHLLFFAELVDRRGQKEVAAGAYKRLVTEHPLYGPGLVRQADHLLRNNKAQEARQVLKVVLDRPHLLDRIFLAEAFVVAAKTLEALKDFPRALSFANSARSFHYNREEAMDVFFRVRSRMPETKEAYSLLIQGRQRENAKEIEKAQSFYTRALELNRRDPQPFLLLADLFEGRGEIKEAIDRYQKALHQTPVKPIEAPLNLARIFANRFELEQANANLKIAREMGRQRDQAEYLRGIIQLRQRRTDLARPHFEKALSLGSRHVPLYLQMGDLETEAKNQKLAEFYYSVALRYEPFHPKAMLGVALSRFALDSPTRAVSFLKDKLATQPNSAPILTNLAIIYLQSGDQDSGKNYLQNAIRSDSRYAEAFRLLGDLTKNEGNRLQDNYDARRHSYRYALASYEMYSRLAPNDPEGYKATGDLYFDIRDLGAAAKNYHRVIELTPNYPDVRLRLAQISRNGGDHKRAMDLLDEELKINPRSDSALVEMGRVHMAQKQFDEANRAFTQAARINEKNADALYGIGVVHHVQGSYDNALSLLNRVIKLDPLKADAYWQIGLIYQKLNNRANAIQAFTNFRGLARDPEKTAQADAKLRELR